MEENGLAQTMAYGSGEGNTVKHYYAGDQRKMPKVKEASKKNDKLKGKMQTTIQHER